MSRPIRSKRSPLMYTWPSLTWTFDKDSHDGKWMIKTSRQVSKCTSATLTTRSWSRSLSYLLHACLLAGAVCAQARMSLPLTFNFFLVRSLSSGSDTSRAS